MNILCCLHSSLELSDNSSRLRNGVLKGVKRNLYRDAHQSIAVITLVSMGMTGAKEMQADIMT